MAHYEAPLVVAAFVDGFLDSSQPDRQERDPSEYEDAVLADDTLDSADDLPYGLIQDAYATGASWHQEFAQEIDMERGGGSGPMTEYAKRVTVKYLARAALIWQNDLATGNARFAGGMRPGAAGIGRRYEE